MLREIGSNFWISPNDDIGGKHLGTPKQFGCSGNDYVWLSTGRSAISLVLQNIELQNPNIEKVALIPSYTCHTVIEPFLKFGYKVHAFPVSKKLETTTSQILNMVQSTKAKVFIFHLYYGFNTMPDFHNCVEKLRDIGVITIEDCTQSLFSDFQKSNADYFVASIRKWSGVPDGGFAVCRDGVLNNKPFEQDIHLQEAKRIASEKKYNYIFNNQGDKSTYKLKYREAEEILDMQSKFYSISSLSADIQANLDIGFLKQQRRNNYVVLQTGMDDISRVKTVMENLPENVVPLYFPIFIDDRDTIQNLLADNDVYAPVVWPMADCCPAIDNNSYYLYEHLLCIPIDQRYDTDDMQRIIEILKR